ncbi:unnamed protein product [Calypogeia fissa]
MGHAVPVHPQVPGIAMAGSDRLAMAVQQQQHFSLFWSSAFQMPLRVHSWTSEGRTTLCGLSSSTLSTRLSICCASQRPATTGSIHPGRDKADGRDRTRGNRPDFIEEDIYTIDDGWKVDFDASEEMMAVAGVQIPVRLKQQLKSVRRIKKAVVEKTPVEPPRETHKLLRVMAGRCAGKKLTSPADAKVRPMMEVVRGAVFNILQSLDSWNPSSPSGRWLDLYSGTGSVAIEAMSRGCCAEAHFVEMDPWVVTNVLRPNLEETNCHNQTVIHTSKVETLLENASKHGAEAFGGAFDYVSVTPPYEAVSYTELMAQLSASPLLSDNAFMVVEYPIKSKHEMPDACGALIRIKDRRYGRTFVAIYGPQWLERDEPKVKRGISRI